MKNAFSRQLARLTVAALLVAITFAISAQAQQKTCEGVRIRFFAGGAEGDAFGSIVYRGALAAASDLGARVEYVFSGWSTERMLAQFRDAIAAKPDGIAMMGHAGDAALMPLVEQASQAGILVMFQNVDVPEVRKKFGGGYAGSNLASQGRALGEEALRTLPLKKGDRAIVFGAWGQPGRFIREEETAKRLEEAGLMAERLLVPTGAATDPNLLIPTITGAFLKSPDIKLIVYGGGQILGAAPRYMEAIRKKPGEVYNIGFDTSPAVIDAFRKGYVQITADQQPFLQGYIPILSLCLTKKLGLAPLNVDTGAGFVDTNNYSSVADLAIKGLR